MNLPRFIAGALLLAVSAASSAIDFRSVGNAPAILYDAPSAKGNKLFVAPRGMPVEVVLTYGEWVKVRDFSGDLAWTEAKSLSAKRMLVVRVPNAKIRATADDNGAPAFTADKGVLLEMLDTQAAAWVKVRHKDGLTGFVKATDVWGL